MTVTIKAVDLKFSYQQGLCPKVMLMHTSASIYANPEPF